MDGIVVEAATKKMRAETDARCVQLRAALSVELMKLPKSIRQQQLSTYLEEKSTVERAVLGNLSNLPPRASFIGSNANKSTANVHTFSRRQSNLPPGSATGKAPLPKGGARAKMSKRLPAETPRAGWVSVHDPTAPISTPAFRRDLPATPKVSHAKQTQGGGKKEKEGLDVRKISVLTEMMKAPPKELNGNARVEALSQLEELQSQLAGFMEQLRG